MRRMILILSLFSVWVALLPGATHAQTNRLCFDVPGIEHCIEGRFREYWERNGGLAAFGYPLTPARYEHSTSGSIYLTQWFERNSFELHPEYSAPYDVLLGRLSDERMLQQARMWVDEPKDAGRQDGCLWFPTTGFNVCDQAPGQGFKAFYQAHGLRFDNNPAVSPEESLALIGYPISSVKRERNAAGYEVLTQWFERARLEWYPNNSDAYKVQMGLLGVEIRTHVYPIKPTCDQPIMPQLQREWNERISPAGVSNRIKLGCPNFMQRDLNSVPLSGAIQEFEKGIMLWISPTSTKGQPVGSILVIFYEQPNRYMSFPDYWIEGDRTNTDIAPAGLYVPQRGFGKVWREQEGVRQALGWAVAPEKTERPAIQVFDHGVMHWLQDSDTVYTVYYRDLAAITPRLK